MSKDCTGCVLLKTSSNKSKCATCDEEYSCWTDVLDPEDEENLTGDYEYLLNKEEEDESLLS